MKNTLIFTGGSSPALSLVAPILPLFPLRIAADSGLDYCAENGIGTDFAVGDFDSVENIRALNQLGNEHVFKYDTDKDDTDTELALKLAKGKKAGFIGLIGGGEGRLDHTLALLHMFQQPMRPDFWVTSRETVFPVENGFTVHGDIGDVLSLFPLSPGCCFRSSTGLHWPLDGLDWQPGTFGLSNRLTAPEAVFQLTSGRCLLVIPHTQNTASNLRRMLDRIVKIH